MEDADAWSAAGGLWPATDLVARYWRGAAKIAAMTGRSASRETSLAVLQRGHWQLAVEETVGVTGLNEHRRSGRWHARP